MSKLSLNERIALKITKAVGSMPAAYCFTLLSLVSLPVAIHSGNALVIVSWIAQTFLQLVLLPIIMVGQDLQNRHHESHAKKLDAIHRHLKIRAKK